MNPILEQDVQFIKGVGPKRAELLRKLGLGTLRQLVEHIPRDYLDYSRFIKVKDLKADEPATVEVRVHQISTYRPQHRRNLAIVSATLTDGSGYFKAVWFNQPWLEKALPPGTAVIVSGRLKRERGALQMDNPLWEVLEEESELLHAGRIMPVYPLTEGLRPREMRRLMQTAVAQAAEAMPELVPEYLRRRRHLLAAPQAWRGIHWPDTWAQMHEALRTIKYQELLTMMVGIALLKENLAARDGIGHSPDGPLAELFREQLPFRLTAAQEAAIVAIKQDMERTVPMNRLVQGDVGSGKTVVAAAAVVKCVESGYQAALMAPTEILVEQHFHGLRRLLEPLGVEVVLVAGGQGRRLRRDLAAALATQRKLLAVGTHALIEEQIQFGDLGLVVIDEQHRFGVRQRAALQAKRQDQRSPDVLVMTATPIPRTVAMTLYGDLDLTVIDEKPPGRRDVATVWRKPADRDHVYQTLVDQFVRPGQQAYVIAPLVEESEKLEALAATELFEELSAKFPELRLGLMHGRLKAEAKDSVMEAFRTGALDVLVSTTVVEVGVDVPNATVMVIEAADRFGLAQLHQLRGRVGRGSLKSYCVLVADPKTEEGIQRMMLMQKTSSGFELSEKDLELRGPGEYLGTQQSGWGLQFAHITRDRALLEEARDDAAELVRSGDLARYPELLGTVRSRWGDRLGLARVG